MVELKTTIGGFVMSRKYEKVRELLPIIKEMSVQGKTQQQIAMELGLANKKVVCIAKGKKKSKVCLSFVAASRQRPCKSTNTKTSA